MATATAHDTAPVRILIVTDTAHAIAPTLALGNVGRPIAGVVRPLTIVVKSSDTIAKFTLAPCTVARPLTPCVFKPYGDGALELAPTGEQDVYHCPTVASDATDAIELPLAIAPTDVAGFDAIDARLRTLLWEERARVLPPALRTRVQTRADVEALLHRTVRTREEDGVADVGVAVLGWGASVHGVDVRVTRAEHGGTRWEAVATTWQMAPPHSNSTRFLVDMGDAAAAALAAATPSVPSTAPVATGTGADGSAAAAPRDDGHGEAASSRLYALAGGFHDARTGELHTMRVGPYCAGVGGAIPYVSLSVSHLELGRDNRFRAVIVAHTVALARADVIERPTGAA